MNHCYLFSARRVSAFARVKALVESKGFLNPSLRRLGIVALRTVEVLGRRRLVRRRRRRHRRRQIVDKSVVKIVARLRKCAAASLSPKIYHGYLLSGVDSTVIIAAVYFAISLRSD